MVFETKLSCLSLAATHTAIDEIASDVFLVMKCGLCRNMQQFSFELLAQALSVTAVCNMGWTESNCGARGTGSMGRQLPRVHPQGVTGAAAKGLAL